MKTKYQSSHENRGFLGIIIAAAFGLGIIVAWIQGYGSDDKISVISRYFLTQYKYSEINYSQLLVYIVMQRVPLFLAVLILGRTAVGRQAVSAIAGWFGFSMGYLYLLAVMKYGVKGLGLMAGLLFPHYILYIPALWFTAKLALQRRQRKRGDFLLAMFILNGIYILGILLENYVNPWFLNSVLKFL